ncbi:unnamed protein product [Camellia sinensis]
MSCFWGKGLAVITKPTLAAALMVGNVRVTLSLRIPVRQSQRRSTYVSPEEVYFLRTEKPHVLNFE